MAAAGAFILCDRAEGLARAALWRGKNLTDLFVDSLAHPDKTGAIVRGKIARVRAGQKAGFLSCGVWGDVYVEAKEPLKSGELRLARIKADKGYGKAPSGFLLPPSQKGEGAQVGEVAPPPAPWQRALATLDADEKVTLLFAHKEDHAAFDPSVWPRVTASLNEHPAEQAELEEAFAALSQPRVPLQGGSHLVIQQTEAFVSVDVNAGEAANPLAVNLLAVREVARQIRLRNMSGIIVVDCLKMSQRADTSKVVNAFARAAEQDPAKPKAFGITKLGLLEIVRPVSGPSIEQAIARQTGLTEGEG